MKKTTILLFICLMISALGTAGTPGEKIVAGKVRDGHALLTDMSLFFSDISRTGKGIEIAEKRLYDAIADTAATFRASRIDPIFHHRYRRLLLIYRLIMTKVTVDNNVWEPVIKHEMSEFIRDVLGEEWALSFKDKSNIGRLAAAMEEEFVSLWIYLDTLERRGELKKKYGHRMLPPPPPPPEAVPPPPPKKSKTPPPPPPK